jgi:hypothetical protein
LELEERILPPFGSTFVFLYLPSPIDVSLVANPLKVLTVLVISMLQQLTELSKVFVAVRAMVGQFGHLLLWIVGSTTTTIRQAWYIRQVTMHRPILSGKVINLTSCTFSTSTAPTTRSTFHMLYRVGTIPESLFATNWTCYGTWTMNLLMHLQIVAIPKVFTTGRTLNGIPAAAIRTARVARSLSPLIGSKLIGVTLEITLGTPTTHFQSFLFLGGCASMDCCRWGWAS